VTYAPKFTAADFAARVPDAKFRNGKGKLRCPLHKDDTASLEFTDDRNGELLLTCFGGCDRKQLYRHYRDLGVIPKYSSKSSRAPMKPKPLPAATAPPAPTVTVTEYAAEQHIEDYIYTDLDGNPIARKRRFKLGNGKKTMKWQHLTDRGWKSGAPAAGVRTLYRITDVYSALKESPDRTVLVVEGEKDTNTAFNLGIPATSKPIGASEPWCDAYTQQLKRANKVCIIADADEAGRKSANDILPHLVAAGIETRLIELPQKDLTDYIEAGGTFDSLRDIILAAAPLTATEPTALPVVAESTAPPATAATDPMIRHGVYLNTDLCNAHRFAIKWADTTKHDGNCWYYWKGTHWQCDENNIEITARASKTVTDMRDELQEPLDSDVQKALQQWIIKSQKHAQIKAILPLAAALPAHRVHRDDFDKNPYLINCKNGIVDIRTGELQPHDPELMCSRLVNVNYNPDADSSLWEEFMLNIMPGGDGTPDMDMVRFLHDAIGYSFTGLQTHAAFFFCYGQGHNGKSTMLETLVSIAGSYGTTVNKNNLMLRSEEASASPGIAKLQHLRFGAVSEVTPGDKLNEGTVKMLTGGDRVPARYLYQNEITFEPTHHLWGAGNQKPAINGRDEGIWRRIHLIPFNASFTDPDTSIKERFLSDDATREGILSWIVRGAYHWYNNGCKLSKPLRMEIAIAAYRLDMDSVAQFLDEECLIGKDYIEDHVRLYKAYEAFCASSRLSALGKPKFKEALKERGIDPDKRTNKDRFCKGVCLATG
jgi:P4 family phage/plasmid primase-like protien